MGLNQFLQELTREETVNEGRGITSFFLVILRILISLFKVNTVYKNWESFSSPIRSFL